MFLMLLGLALIFAGIVVRGVQLNPLSTLKSTTGKLLGYERNKSNGEFHPIITFNFMTDKYFFKNTNTFKFPRFVLGSEHSVYFDVKLIKNIISSPVQASLGYFQTNSNLAWILVMLGTFSFLLFTQLTGAYLILFLFLIAMYYFYNWAKNNLYSADIFKMFIKEDLLRYPLSECFPEEHLKQIQLLDLPSLRILREQWLVSQKTKAFGFITLAALCLALSTFSSPLKEVTNTVPVVKKALTVEQVLDAGSVEAAEEQFGSGDKLKLCPFYLSESCLYTYNALNEADTSLLFDKFLNFLVIDVGIIFFLLSLLGFSARKIYNIYDNVETPPKKVEKPLT